MMEFLNSMRGEPNYYGSLERLPLAPVRGKPPPYASRRQQSRRGGALKGIRGLSSSTGDLTSSSRSRANSSTSNEGDWEDWGGGGGGGGGGGSGGSEVEGREGAALKVALDSLKTRTPSSTLQSSTPHQRCRPSVPPPCVPKRPALLAPH